MSERTRNVAVGLTVLVALAMLAGMIVIFAGLPEAFQRGYRIRIQSDSTHEINEGDPVHLAGMRVGRIIDIGFTDPDDPTAGVTLTARIEPDKRVPANAKAFIYTRGFVGSPYVALEPDGPLPPERRFLPTDRVTTIQAEHKGTGLLPDELRPALEGLARLTDNLNDLIAPESKGGPATATAPATGTATAPTTPGVKGMVAKLNRTLDALHAVLGDAENQRNIHDALANIREAAEATSEAMDAMEAFAADARQAAASARRTLDDVRESSRSARQRMEDVSGKLMESAERISELMSTINRIAEKIESGEGTAGRLVNDPDLYNNLLEATREMSRLVTEFRALVETWKETGVPIKVK
jgi:phospholipid/cholesterol/gamma-HCH transport system substrate-binding protein